MKALNPVLFISLLLVAPFFFIGGPDYYSPRSFRAAWDFGHIIFFAVATYLALCKIPALAQRSFTAQLVIVVCVSLVLGLFIEAFQYWFSRQPDFSDIVNNSLGALMAVTWFSTMSRTVNKPVLLIVKGVLVAALSLRSLPLLTAIYDEWKASVDFPVLAEFESPLELDRWSGNVAFSRSHEHAVNGDYSLKIELNTQRYSGVNLNYLPPDWRGYDQLVFDVNSLAPEPLPINVRVHDKQHRRGEQLYSDRFNRSFLLQQGWNSIAIDLPDIADAPEARANDLSAIAGIGLFVIDQQTEKTIFLDGLRLVKATP